MGRIYATDFIKMWKNKTKTAVGITRSAVKRYEIYSARVPLYMLMSSPVESLQRISSV